MATREGSAGGDGPASAPTVEIPAFAPPRPGRVRLEIGARTHVGLVRPNNEDQHLVARLSKVMEVLAGNRPEGPARLVGEEAYLLVVADGMGGAGGGEVASARAVEAAKMHWLHTAKWFLHHGDPEEEIRERTVSERLEGLDRELVEEGNTDPSLAGMGTTLTAAISVGDEVSLLHVGDSRAYRFRGGELEQLTHDHTITQQFVDSGLVHPEEARSHRLRHMLTNVVGGRPGVRGDVKRLRMADGDRLLLCTDGLTEMVADARLAEVLAQHPDPDDACRALVEAALEGGGKDNVTVVLTAYSVTQSV